MAELSDVELKSNIGYWFKLKKKKKTYPILRGFREQIMVNIATLDTSSAFNFF
jgi:hypothetical protein